MGKTQEKKPCFRGVWPGLSLLPSSWLFLSGTDIFFSITPPGQEEVRVQINRLLSRLEDHYGLSPVLYATKASYELYLAGDYKEYDIWIRDVVTHPCLTDAGGPSGNTPTGNVWTDIKGKNALLIWTYFTEQKKGFCIMQKPAQRFKQETARPVRRCLQE